MRLVLHCEPRIPWQPKRAAYFLEGFRRKGIECEVTDSRQRLDERPAVLLGTSCWRAVEATGSHLLVDRCSFGDTEKFVSLVWNGHGRRGRHMVPHNANGERWERYGVPIENWKYGSRVILCGQTETYSPRFQRLEDWYRTVSATHFRKHPAGDNPTGLPDAVTFDDCSEVITLNSSVAVQCVLSGYPVVAMDEGSMAWDVSGHRVGDLKHVGHDQRRAWAEWLAWTQWTDDEIREGAPWDYHL